ncbi:MAG: hypothetical protein JNJ41_18445 [Bacteroidia bacterium]|nr:hypothetical protein [Bacteroidia bacterium]
MKESILSPEDKNEIKGSIGFSLILSFLFCLLLVILVGIVPLIMFLFSKRPVNGAVQRGLFITGVLFIPFMFVVWKNIFKYIDLKRDKKLRFETSDYQIKKKKGSVILLVLKPSKLKFDIDEDLSLKIDATKPLTIEFVPLSKTLLFISHSEANLLNGELNTPSIPDLPDLI